MDFLDLAKARYSVRKYKDAPVEQEKIDAILEAAKVAPTARNSQPQKIYVCQSKEALEKINKETPCGFGAPVIFIIAYDKTREASAKEFHPGLTYGVRDSSIVQTHMMLAAADLGLGSCWVGLYKPTVADHMGLGENIVVTGLLPVGYPADDSEPNVRHTEFRPDEEMVEYL